MLLENQTELGDWVAMPTFSLLLAWSSRYVHLWHCPCSASLSQRIFFELKSDLLEDGASNSMDERDGDCVGNFDLPFFSPPLHFRQRSDWRHAPSNRELRNRHG